ncbi:hypothetical protein [Bradyrhizobium yuanmingense]|uniref:hypothetical protein n=1 Tax=Bradyrhizobium yuanmingense TaxID=108015 RepID=UPI0023BA0F46|nr:hypothetical protein [Bradyrhizobium yuanmingense]MDF0582123.1 hypothetical protein [Bradyrhizobium yuanmingense]
MTVEALGDDSSERTALGSGIHCLLGHDDFASSRTAELTVCVKIREALGISPYFEPATIKSVLFVVAVELRAFISGANRGNEAASREVSATPMPARVPALVLGRLACRLAQVTEPSNEPNRNTKRKGRATTTRTVSAAPSAAVVWDLYRPTSDCILFPLSPSHRFNSHCSRQ